MSSRIQKIKDTYSEQLQKRLEQESVSISLESVWDIMISADPTKNKKHVRWLIETYLNNGYLWEDIMGGPTSKVFETLVAFDKHKRNLEPADRSLTKYQALGALWSAIKPYVGQLTAGEEKKEERDQAYAEAEVVVDRDNGLKIIVPLTEYSAKWFGRGTRWFGRGTRWCTSADKNNMFMRYADEAPLFIIMMPNGDKLQIWNDSQETQFMDENDTDVSIEYIEEHWSVLEPVIKCLNNLQYVPDKYVTDEMNQAIVRDSGLLLSTIDNEHKTEEVCKIAVSSYGSALSCVPAKKQTKEICKIAVEQDGNAYLYVDNRFKTPELFMKALKSGGSVLSLLAKTERTYEICKIAIEHNATQLNDVPKELMTPELCEIAVKQDSSILGMIESFGYADEKLYKMAFEYNKTSFQYIPPEYRTSEMVTEFLKYIDDNIETNGTILQHIPEEMRTIQMYKKAIAQTCNSIYFISDAEKTQEICDEIVRHHPMYISYLPEHALTPELVKIAVSQEPQGIYYVPDDMLTDDFMASYHESVLREKMNFKIPEDKYKQKIEFMKEQFQSPEPSLKM